jgi:uracil-DNA glycosylase family 4
MPMANDAEDETTALRRALAAYASWEAVLGGDGWPVVDPSSRALRSEPQAEAPSSALSEPLSRLRVLADEAAACTRCALHRTRGASVYARGDEASRIVFVGPAPTRADEAGGAPLLGEAGALLDRMIVAMGLTPESAYVCSVVKCALPDDDELELEDREACTSHLVNQIEAVRPEMIVALGEDAARALIGPLAREVPWRGAWRAWQGVPVMPTHAPAEVLANPALRRPVWEDLQAVMARLGLRR